MPVDTSGQLVDGTPLHGPADLRQALLSRSDAFVTTATERLLTYAMGRPVEYLRHADGAGHRPPRGEERLPVLVAGSRRDRERAVPDEDEEATIMPLA